MDTLLKRPAREPWPPARRAYAPEGTEKSPSSLDQQGLCKGFTIMIEVFPGLHISWLHLQLTFPKVKLNPKRT
ncbi:MAG: hypothetical protein ACQEQO_05490 [Thermodesulfobacteriota bacterium]